MPRTQTDIATIAAALRDAKEQHKPVTLLLGSRAGVFSSEDCLYKALAQRIVPTSNSSRLLKHLAPSDENALHLLESQLHMLKTLSSLDKFKACYTILKQLSEGGIYTILTDALVQVRYREEDELLAGLIKAHFFDVIITTNIDTLLEDACEALWNMRSPNDYQVIRCGIEKSEEIERGKPTYGQVIKLFGDLNSLTYKAGNNEFVLDADQTLEKILQAKLSEEVLVIGYDPIWDQPVERAFQETGKRVWYVNEEVLSPDTYLAQVLAQRGGGDLAEDQGRYDNFVKELSHYLGSGTSELTQVMPPLPLPQPQEQRKNRVFVSCNS
jgi:SIR2-like domain